MEKKTRRHSKFKSWSVQGPRTSVQQSDCEFTDDQLLGFFNRFKYYMIDLNNWFEYENIQWNPSLNHSYEFVLYFNVSLKPFWNFTTFLSFCKSEPRSMIRDILVKCLRSRSYIFVISIVFTSFGLYFRIITHAQ